MFLILFHLQYYNMYLIYFWVNNNITQETLGIKKVTTNLLLEKIFKKIMMFNALHFYITMPLQFRGVSMNG
jgi:hypothetical protein